MAHRPEFSAAAYLRAFGAVFAPVGHLSGLVILGSGSSGETPTHLELMFADVRVDNQRREFSAFSDVHHLLFQATMSPELRFPLELRVEQTEVRLPVDGRPHDFTVLTCGDQARARARIGDIHVVVTTTLSSLETAAIRSLDERELSAVLTARA